MLKKLLYIFQLEGYDVSRFRKWLRENKVQEIVESKQKIKWTAKAKALYFWASIINILTFGKITQQSLILAYQLLLFSEKLAIFIVITKAKYKISRRRDLIVIGITGSYGKTSVKEILSHLLSVKYRVLKTPDSYNTPLGISKIINRELKREHQVFVVEMGAHQKGDIKALCELVKPQIGIITSIGKQHLERFGSEEKIEETKFELADGLPTTGKLFLNVNDPKIYNRSKKYPKEFIVYFGVCADCIVCKNVNVPNCNTTLKVNDISTTLHGTVFTIITDQNESRNIVTPLLGKHNVRNIMAAINVAYYLNIPFPDIEKQCLTFKPIPHRLQLIKGVNDTTIIDDAFNANPDSARAALDVLTDFPAARKIIITPGLVELGNKQRDENKIFGAEMVEVADYIIVVGETNRNAIVEGINSKDLEEITTASANVKKYFAMVKESEKEKENDKIITVKNLDEAMERLKEIVIPKSVILFENDLPDQYI